jgi:hypothetical protein
VPVTSTSAKVLNNINNVLNNECTHRVNDSRTFLINGNLPDYLYNMELTLTTPALLFPTVSLILLAYTNRFLAVAALIRKLANDYQNKEDKKVADQIRNLKVRLRLIRDMQMLSIFSLFLSVLCMFFLFSGHELIAKYIFGTSLLSLLISLGMSLREIQISTRALSIQLSDIADDVKLWDPLKDLVGGKRGE